MDIRKAEALVDKYYKGETTAEEELQLREFFSTADNIPGHLIPEKELFSLYSKAVAEEVPVTGFMENLEKVIDEQSSIKLGTRKPALYWISGLAAGVALLLAGYFLIVHKPADFSDEYAVRDTYQDPQLAYEETQKVLLYISQKMNEGTLQLHNVAKLSKPVQNLQNLKKLDTGISQLQMLQFLDNHENKN